MAGAKHLLFTVLLSTAALPALSCFPAIFSFGDSIADTGNRLISTDGKVHAGPLPYGETYFNRPTGRFSDGRLIVDFIAEAVGVPMLPPYLGGMKGQDGFARGVNFAVAGATALTNDFSERRVLMWIGRITRWVLRFSGSSSCCLLCVLLDLDLISEFLVHAAVVAVHITTIHQNFAGKGTISYVMILRGTSAGTESI